MPKIVYKLANQEDEGAIRTFLREHYFADEPLTNIHYLGPSNYEDEEEYILSLLPEGLSLKAIDEDTGEIVGCVLATKFYPESADDWQQTMATSTSREWVDSLGLIVRLDKMADIRNKYKGQRILYGYLVAVNKNYRGQNIAPKLNEYYLLNGGRMGYDLYCIDCTNALSVGIASKHMDCVASIAYADYRDESGRVVYKTRPPNTHAKRFLYKL